MLSSGFYIIILIILINQSSNIVDGLKITDVNLITVRNKMPRHVIQMQPSKNSISDSIAYSVEIALASCKKQFLWDRWNCPTVDFLSKRTNRNLDRETAYVQAITVAALIYTVTKNCSRGELDGCGCDFNKIKDDSKWQWNGCSDEIQFGENLVEKLFDETNQPSWDAQGYAEMHNKRAAKIAIRNSLKNHCRCHGISGSCALQSCWVKMNSFVEIAINLRKMYDQAVLLTVDNSGNVNTNINEETLVYLLDSPNYCNKNEVNGWLGMRGRQCSRNRNEETTSAERKSCKQLCKSCGLRVRRQQKVLQKRCNCKFNWCCDVACDLCTEVVDEYFCD